MGKVRLLDLLPLFPSLEESVSEDPDEPLVLRVVRAIIDWSGYVALFRRPD